MKVLNNITIKNLKLNKKRTIVTIIGIALSVALICAVTTFVSSFQSAMVEREKKKNGNYYIYFQNTTEKQIEDLLVQNDKVKSLAKSQEIGYANLKDSANDYKPYVYIESFDEISLKNRGVILKEGSLPRNENEIIIPEHVLTNGGQNWKIGDKITLDIGKRTLDGESLEQNNPYNIEENEKIEIEKTKEYTIVGIMERPSFEEYSAPGYTLITKLDNIDLGKPLDVTILLKNPKETYEVQTELKKHLIFNNSDVITNDSLLQFLGVFKSSRTNEYIIFLASIVIAIIMFTSIFVIRNSFNISLTEKTRELGILASIGATTKQLRKSVLFESIIYALISIPLGIVIGTLAIGIVLFIVNNLLTSGGVEIIDNFNLKLVISIIPISIAVLTSFIMIILSAIKPAIRASKISPIDAIRSSNDIKIKSRKLHTSKLTKKLFGIEGEIASKNFKRSKKKYRTTIFSIFLSIVLFLSMQSIVSNVFDVSSTQYVKRDYNMYVSSSKQTNKERLDYFEEITNLNGIENYVLEKSAILDIDKNHITKEHLEIYNTTSSVAIYAIGEKAYNSYLKELGLTYDEANGKAILYDTNINYVYEEGKDGVKRVEYRMTDFNEGDNISYIQKKYDLQTGYEIEVGSGDIEVIKITDKLPMGNLLKTSQFPTLIVSDTTIENFDYTVGNLYLKANNAEKLQEQISNIDKSNTSNIYNIEADVKAQNNIVLVISIFLYGFIIVISIIGITNIFNTITTNMALRNREFAILKSIGMTDKQFKKMIRYESLFYGLKALLFGLPIGIILSYLIYTQTANIYQSGYKIPFISIGICIVFVFAIIFITMRYAIRKSNNQNIIETIRREVT